MFSLNYRKFMIRTASSQESPCHNSQNSHSNASTLTNGSPWTKWEATRCYREKRSRTIHVWYKYDSPT